MAYRKTESNSEKAPEPPLFDLLTLNRISQIHIPFKRKEVVGYSCFEFNRFLS